MAGRRNTWVLALAGALAVSGCGGGSGAPQGGSTGGSGPGGGSAGGGGGTGGGGTGGTGGFTFGTPGPWPVSNAIYGAADGILDSPVVGMTTDEAQNRWVATHDALYLLAPGATAFRRFDQRDGLHMHGNAVHYCSDRQVALDHACPGAESWGEGKPPGITALAGGRPGEVFVGYAAVHPDGNDCGNNGGGEDWCDPDRHTGKIDRVQLQPDGTLKVDRLDLVAINHGAKYWHDRTIERLLYDHRIHAHTLYAGTEHGVAMLLPDWFRLPNPGEWFNDAYKEWMGDHLHARVCFERACDASGAGQRIGDWNGLALDASGDLWHAGRWTAGLVTWDADPVSWFARNGAAFAIAFGDPYGGPGSGLAPGVPGGQGRPFRVPDRGGGLSGRPGLVREPGTGGRSDLDDRGVRRVLVPVSRRGRRGASRTRGPRPRLPARWAAGHRVLLLGPGALRPLHRVIQAHPRRLRPPQRPGPVPGAGYDAQPPHAARGHGRGCRRVAGSAVTPWHPVPSP